VPLKSSISLAARSKTLWGKAAGPGEKLKGRVVFCMMRFVYAFIALYARHAICLLCPSIQAINPEIEKFKIKNRT
jgi:hypothetical protein